MTSLATLQRNFFAAHERQRAAPGDAGLRATARQAFAAYTMAVASAQAANERSWFTDLELRAALKEHLAIIDAARAAGGVD